MLKKLIEQKEHDISPYKNAQAQIHKVKNSQIRLYRSLNFSQTGSKNKITSPVSLKTQPTDKLTNPAEGQQLSRYLIIGLKYLKFCENRKRVRIGVIQIR